MPDLYLTEYELCRIKFNTQGSTGKTTENTFKMLIIMFYIFRVLIHEILLAPEKSLEGINLSVKAKRNLKLIAGYITHVICLDFYTLVPIIPKNMDVIVHDERVTEPIEQRSVYGF